MGLGRIGVGLGLGWVGQKVPSIRVGLSKSDLGLVSPTSNKELSQITQVCLSILNVSLKTIKWFVLILRQFDNSLIWKPLEILWRQVLEVLVSLHKQNQMEWKRAKNIFIYLFFCRRRQGFAKDQRRRGRMMKWPTSGRRRLWALCSVRRQISIDTSLSFTQYIWGEKKTHTHAIEEPSGSSQRPNKSIRRTSLWRT